MIAISIGKQIFNLVSFLSLLFIGSNILMDFLQVPSFLEEADETASLTIKIIAGVVAIIKGYDLFFEAKHKRKMRIEDLKGKKYDNIKKKHEIEDYDENDGLLEFGQRIKNGEIKDFELYQFGFTDSEIEKLKNID